MSPQTPTVEMHPQRWGDPAAATDLPESARTLVDLAFGLRERPAVTGMVPPARVLDDVLLDGRKLAGILVEARPQDGWAVFGIGINVAQTLYELPVALATSVELETGEPVDRSDLLGQVLGSLHGLQGLLDDPEALRRRVEHDLYYIENWSVWLDLYVLAMTPLRLITTRNAY